MSQPILAFWVDTETTGVDVEKGIDLVELSYIVTELWDNYPIIDHPLATGTFLVCEDFDFESYAEQMHKENGLLDDLERARNGMPLSNPDVRVVYSHQELDDILCKIMQVLLAREYTFGYSEQQTRFKAAGSNVSYDLGVLKRNLPNSMKFLSYNGLDVSSTRTLVQTQPKFADLPKWKSPEQIAHRAQDDIHDHLAEMRYYVAAMTA